MSRDIYIFAGGRTGGHLYPGLAVAEQLMQIRPQARIVFACSDGPVDSRILDPAPYAAVRQPVKPLPRRLKSWPGFLWAWFRRAASARHDSRPSPRGRVGTGRLCICALVREAHSAGIPAALLNPDALPGKANRYLSRLVSAIFTQFESTAEAFPPRLRSRVRCVGCPIRADLLAGQRDEAIRHFDLQADRKTLLIFGGSQLSSAINAASAAMAGNLAGLADTWQLLHVTGAASDEDAAAAYDRSGIHARTLEYCRRMDLAYAAADLALCRGGASTVAELAATATPAVILPYPHHRDRQQELNALSFVQAGAGVRVDEALDVATNVASLRATLLPIMAGPERLESMHQAAGDLAKPHADREVAQWLVGDAE